MTSDQADRGQLEVRAMDEQECRALLAGHSLGRLAFSFRDRVDIQPLHFVLDGDWLFGRTSEGEKLETLEHHRWVAFQVDRVQDAHHWESVVVRGAFHVLSARASRDESRLLERATTVIRTHLPWSFSEADPTPQRTVVFGISIQEVSGRRARLVAS